MEYLFLLCSVAFASVRSMASKRLSGSTSRIGSFGIVNAIIASLAVIVISGYTIYLGNYSLSPLTILLAVLFALFTVSAQLCYMRAMGGGKVSSVTFFYSCGFLIPTFAGLIFWEESLSTIGIIGIALLVPSLRLCASKGEDPNSVVNSGRGWMIWAALATVSAGVLGLIQKIHQTSEVKDELGTFLLLSLSLTAAISFGLIFCRGKDRTIKQDLDFLGRRGMLIAAICGVCFGAANIINLVLTGRIPAVIFFPVVNGGTIILSSLLAWLIRGEKINRRQLTGLALGMCAIVLIAFK